MGHLCRSAARRLLALIPLLSLAACEKKAETGVLRVVAGGPGAYDVYRIANESPLQFVSEQAGQFNEDVALAPGSYLVLADCSSETVIIYPGQTQTLVTHKIEFVPPHPPIRQDGFSIQCSRSDKTRSRQHLSNRFELNVLHGRRDLLVGMVPLHIDFTKQLADATQPGSLSYQLAALQIEGFDGKVEDLSYFVSPVDELTSVTQSQTFGQWSFLLPGSYVLEVNGTRMEVSLAAGEERAVKPARLTVSTSPDVDLDQAVRIKGSPWLVEINGGHSLSFNASYPVLPGKISVGISGSTQSIELELVEGNEVELKARSVTVDLGCQPTDMACLGDKDVSLYRAEDPYPFVESVSDIPILYLDEQKPILVGVAGSRDITYELPAKDRDKRLPIGYVKLKPTPIHRTTQVTDLVRVDGSGPPFAGHTLDVNLEKHTLMPLIAGHYRLSHYFSNTSSDPDRRHSVQSFTIEPNKTIELEFQVFFSEKRWSAWKKKADGKG